GHRANLVPPLMRRTEGGLFPADARYGDRDGDGIPEVAVGRVPVTTLAEAHAWVDKLAAYEGTPAPPWGGRAALLADADEGAVSFATDSAEIGAALPAGYETEQVDLASEPLV